MKRSRLELVDRMKEFYLSGKLMRVTTKYFENELHGFVHSVGEELVLIHQFHDFFPDGYSLLRTSDIRRLRRTKGDRFFEHMLEAESLTDKRPPAGLSLDGMSEALEGLARLDRNIIVEYGEPDEKGDCGFLVGRIRSLRETCLIFSGFSVGGIWHGEPDRIRYGDIHQIQFDTPYVNVYSRYVGDPPRLTAD